MGSKLKALYTSKNRKRCLGHVKEALAFRMVFVTPIFVGVTSLYARKDFFGSSNEPWSDLVFLLALVLGLLILLAPFFCLFAGFGLKKAPRAVFVIPFLVTAFFGLALSFVGFLELFGHGRLENQLFVGLTYSVIATVSLIVYNKKRPKEN